MLRRKWWRSMAVMAAIVVASAAGCNRHGVLDPGGPGMLPTDGTVGRGGSDAAVTDAAQAEASQPDARPATADARATTDAGTGAITTAPPVSACARSPERASVQPPVPPNVYACGGSLSLTSAMSLGPAPGD